MTDEPKSKPCPRCGRRLRRRTHMRLAPGSEPREFWGCLVCGYSQSVETEEEER